MKFYLAHPIIVRKKVRKAELKFEEDTGYELINPFYDARERSDIKKIDQGKIRPYSGVLDCESIVEGDLKTIDECPDGIVAWMEKGIQSIGTYMEIWYAYSHGKRVFVITTTWNTHPWIRYVVEHSGGAIVKDFQELKRVILIKTSVRIK